ncbi:phage terminase large subunit family protein [Celeribacter halophilus]|uniref:Phage terminase, large subunit GpA n=1 Tax=Celeribacter halophilus TaxID=576117 RepID=A0A1I3WYM8_9RHOB|nr:phage terminase large subunit family protein [Celeribacter halophilus]PZX03200.1 phage terminase large subunit GpA-like protein [Celeribacter halophilus]SFK12552.1 Phage terminase, large subunit GpA [Celeribacter halophilus]
MISVSPKFEGSDDILKAWLSGIAPDPAFTVTQWADEKRYLSSKGAAEPGKYTSARTPFMQGIMDALSPSHWAQKIVFAKSAQVGATEAGINWIGHVMEVAPGPFLAVQANETTAKRFSRQRIDPMIDATPTIRDIVAPAKQRDSGNTQLEKSFPGGHLIIAGGNSAAGLRSMPMRYVHLDEVDAYKDDLDEEGDPVTLAEARTNTFGRRKKIFVSSTPTVKGASRVEAEFELTDQRRYFVPCPHCLGLQWLKFERLRWDRGEPKSVRYVCEHCEQPIAERHKTWMMDPENGAEWQPTADPEMVQKAREACVIGFHISGLYSPIGWLSWEEIARKFEAAKGKEAQMKAFKNTVLGETWEEKGEAPDWQKLYERREDYKMGTVPKGGLVLTMGVDVQRTGRIEASVWAWGRNSESWLVDHIVLDGDVTKTDVWDDLTDLCDATWMHESGRPMQVARVGIDTGDGMTVDAVYAWVRKMGRGQVHAVKGMGGFDRHYPVDGPSYVDVNEGGKKIKRGVALWKVSVSVYKLETYRWFRLKKPTDEDLAAGGEFPAGYIHTGQGTPPEWFKQATAEQLVSRKNKRTGFSRSEWVKTRDRNEALDCRVYARAVADLMGVDRWDDTRWDDLEAQLNVAEPDKEEQPAGRPQRRRRGKTKQSGQSWLGTQNGKWF